MMNFSKLQMDTLSIAQTLLSAGLPDIAITAASIEERVIQASALCGGLSPDEITQLVEELIRRFSFWTSKDTTLSDNDDHLDWLTTDRKQGWRYWPRYQAMMEKRLSIDAVDALNKSTDDILKLMEDPNRHGDWARYGLINGFVQSGKTGNYTGVICKAADAGYKIIIVLAGLHNNLRAQTQVRLEDGFLGYETSLKGEIIQPLGVGGIDSDLSIKPNCATNRTNNGDFNKRVSKHLAVSPEQRPWLFVVKKNKTVLEELLKWIKTQVANTAASDGRPLVTHLPLLVIDDESDNASVDTGEQTFDEFGVPDEEHNPKTINSLIRQILHSFSRKVYLGYTATPFANIFIHRSGRTSKEGPDLFPRSFITNLGAPSNYIGPSRVFGSKYTEGRTEPLPLIRDVSDHIEDDGEGWMPHRHKSVHLPLYHGTDTIPASLETAILSFILTCAARRMRGQKSAHSSMLIHVTRFTAVQGHIYRQVEKTLTSLRQRLSYNIDTAEIYSKLEQIWNSDFIPTTVAMNTLEPNLVTTAELPDWDDIKSIVPSVVGDIQLKAINGTAKDALDYQENEATGLKVIAIGGDKLARGLTLEGLCVSYFVRTTKMYDTLMQMGRWFGYRPNYLDLCRLFTSSDLVEWFKHIADASEELRQEFDTMVATGDRPRDYGLRVQSHPLLLVTSPLKMRTSKPLQLTFSGDVLETVAFHTDKRILENNLTAATRLIKEMGEPLQKGTVTGSRAGNSWKGHLWADIPPEKIIEFFEEVTTHSGSKKVNSNLINEFIKKMNEEGELINWTVFLVGAGEGGPYQFTDEISVENTVRRTNTSMSSEVYQIGRLLSPIHESVDLDSSQFEEAMELTRLAREEKDKKPPSYPSGPAIRRLRGLGGGTAHGDPRRALLLLYPLDAESAGVEKDGPVMAFGVSFPNSRLPTTISYRVDHLTWEQEYGQAD